MSSPVDRHPKNHLLASCYYNIHRMLSYSALLENSTGHNFFQFHPRHTLICTYFDTTLVVVHTAKKGAKRLLQRELLPPATAVNP